MFHARTVHVFARSLSLPHRHVSPYERFSLLTILALAMVDYFNGA